MPRKAPPADPAAIEQRDSFLPDLPYEDPPEENDQSQAKKGDEGPDPAIAALERRVAELTGRLESAQTERLTLMAQPVRAPTPPPEAPDLTNLPDPLEDKDAYGRELASRLTKHGDQVRSFERATAEVGGQRQRQVDQLWSDFQIDYEDYAEDFDKVQFAAQKVAEKAQAKGVDIDRYMFGHSERFMKDVAAEMDRIFGAPGDDTSETSTSARGEGSTAGGEDRRGPRPGRTSGMFGGQESGGKATRRADPDDKPSDMFVDIRKFQTERGFYR